MRREQQRFANTETLKWDLIGKAGFESDDGVALHVYSIIVAQSKDQPHKQIFNSALLLQSMQVSSEHWKGAGTQITNLSKNLSSQMELIDVNKIWNGS